MRLALFTIVAALALSSLLAATSARAETAEEFFRGKTVTVQIGYAPGGLGDLLSRLLPHTHAWAGLEAVREAAAVLARTRPTAVNLFWALARLHATGRGAWWLMAGAMTGGAYPDGIRPILEAYARGDRDQAFALYQQWLPLINYENRQTGLLAAKVLMQEGGVIACDARICSPNRTPGRRLLAHGNTVLS